MEGSGVEFLFLTKLDSQLNKKNSEKVKDEDLAPSAFPSKYILFSRKI
jgi:hypothetical protein